MLIQHLHQDSFYFLFGCCALFLEMLCAFTNVDCFNYKINIFVIRVVLLRMSSDKISFFFVFYFFRNRF